MKLNGKLKILALSAIIASGVWFFNACSKSETATVVVAASAPVVTFTGGQREVQHRDPRQRLFFHQLLLG